VSLFFILSLILAKIKMGSQNSVKDGSWEKKLHGEIRPIETEEIKEETIVKPFEPMFGSNILQFDKKSIS
jgi:hypothetical protein